MRYLKHWYTYGGVMLINYDMYRALLTTHNMNDKDSYHKYLVNPGADVVVLDEAHRIKNSTSLLSNHVNKIRTRTRICLTGYPLQNHLIEYYYMINFIAPGLLGSRDSFKSYFSHHIEKCYSDSSKSTKLDAAFKLYVLQLLTGHVTHR
jgi:SNF2 family DNA or RNA helicase